MGLFDALFGGRPASRVEITDDKIWISHQARFRGVVKEISSLATSGTDAILVIAHFSNVLEVLKPIVETSLVTIPKMTALAEQLSPAMAEQLGLDEQARVNLIVAEKHPLPSADEAVIAFAEKLPCRSRITYHLSLDDVVLKSFRGEWLQSVLMKLGMTEEETIESKMVTRRLKAAQRKFQSAIRGNHPAASAEEWVRLNMPEAERK